MRKMMNGKKNSWDLLKIENQVKNGTHKHESEMMKAEKESDKQYAGMHCLDKRWAIWEEDTQVLLQK